MKKYLIFLSMVAQLGAQPKIDFPRKVDTLQKLMTAADGVTFQVTDSLDYNGKIITVLTDILSDRESVKCNLEVLLKNDFLNITHSDDKKLWIFGWHENTGGTFKNAMNILQVRQSKAPGVFHDESTSRDSTRTYHDNENVFVSSGFFFSRIIKLNSKKQLYLCLGSVVGCSTCCLETATVIELARDSINFKYPAFVADSTRDQPVYEPAFMLDSRCGNIKQFDYDAKTQTLIYEYEADDLTPVRREYEDEEDSENSQGQIIRQILFWNGERFVEKE